MTENDGYETIQEIELESVVMTGHWKYSVIEERLVTLYENQEKLLKAIKMLDEKLCPVAKARKGL